MVGKLSIAGLRQRLQQVNSHTSSEDYESNPNNVVPVRQHVSFIASPLDPKTTEWLQNKHKTSNFTLKRQPTVAQNEALRIAGGIFRKQHEASPLELFFDLFFVANLAIFSFNSVKATGPSKSSVNSSSVFTQYLFTLHSAPSQFTLNALLSSVRS